MSDVKREPIKALAPGKKYKNGSGCVFEIFAIISEDGRRALDAASAKKRGQYDGKLYVLFNVFGSTTSTEPQGMEVQERDDFLDTLAAAGYEDYYEPDMAKALRGQIKEYRDYQSNVHDRVDNNPNYVFMGSEAYRLLQKQAEQVVSFEGIPVFEVKGFTDPMKVVVS